MKKQIISSQQIPPVQTSADADNPDLGSPAIETIAGLAIAFLLGVSSVIMLKLFKEAWGREDFSLSIGRAVASIVVAVSVCLMGINWVFGPTIRDGNVGNDQSAPVEEIEK